MKEYRVEFIPDRSNPPPVYVNNPEARDRNEKIREEVRAVLDVIKIGQSFKVYGMPYSKISSIVHGMVKGSYIGLTVRNHEEEGWVQFWRSA